MTTPRTIELDLSRATDAGFETSGELLSGRRELAQSHRLDDQERLYEVRHFSQIMLLPAVYRGPLLATYLPEQARDWAQRAASEAAARHVLRATQFQRQSNGFLERAMDGLRALWGAGRARRAS